MKVKKQFKDPLTRLANEGVRIKNRKHNELLNSKAEFYQPAIVRSNPENIRKSPLPPQWINKWFEDQLPFLLGTETWLSDSDKQYSNQMFWRGFRAKLVNVFCILLLFEAIKRLDLQSKWDKLLPTKFIIYLTRIWELDPICSYTCGYRFLRNNIKLYNWLNIDYLIWTNTDYL